MSCNVSNMHVLCICSEEQYEKLEKVYKRKCAVPHIGELKKIIDACQDNIKINVLMTACSCDFNRS